MESIYIYKMAYYNTISQCELVDYYIIIIIQGWRSVVSRYAAYFVKARAE